MRCIPVLFSLLCIAAVRLYGQCPTPDFTIPVSTCLQSLTAINNLSPPANSYSWDFCSGDLNNTPQAQESFMLTAANGRPGIEFAKNGNTWFGFVTGTFSNNLYRLEFGNGIHALPTSTENLGNLSGSLNGPGPLKIVNEAGLWYGFVYNTASGELLKLDFGNSLSNNVTVSIIFSGTGSINAGIALGKDQANGWVCIMSTSLNQFNIIRLGNLISTPGPGDVIVSTTVPNPNNLGDVDLINVCGMWYGFADNLGNGNLYRLDFGTNLFSAPVINQINTISAGNPGRLRIVKEGAEYFLFVIALDGTLTKLEFGTDLTSIPVIIQEGDIGGSLQPNTYGIGIAKENSVWTIMAVSQSNGQFYYIDYPENCSATPRTSTQTNPTITYGQAGNYFVSLESEYSSGSSVKTKSISISPSIAPDISFTSQNICANNDVNFTTENTSGDITDYNWDFDDTNTSMTQDPIHQFTAAGDYEVKLQVTAANGCNNLASETVTIYNAPVANFDLPSTIPICTNQEYLFSNTTSFDAASNPIWQWEVNGVPIATSLDLNYSIPAAIMQDVKLIASIPGCENEITKTINTVEDGPLANFTFSNDCEDKSIDFTNTTIGTVTGYTWDFGDGNGSTQTNAANTFNNFGQYDVTLVATNAAGCVNTSVQEITIYSTPQPDFSIDLPPFSCNGSPTQFNDLTSNPPDSNLDSWSWSFGDQQSGTSLLQNPQYTYLNANQYDVNLNVETNFGCMASVQKTITVSQSPDPAFSFNPACINQATIFTPASTAGINSWQWKIGTSTYSQQAPTHVFNFQSTYSAKLTVNGNNGCIAVLTKPVIVPVAANVDFTSENNCATQNTAFTDLTTTGSDPIVSQAWQFGTIGTGSGATPTFNFPSLGSYPVKLTVTSMNGCSYSISKSVNIVNAPVVSFNATPLTGTPPLTVQLENTSENSVSQLWKVNDPANSTSTEKSPSFTFNELGQYVVDLTVLNAQECAATQSKIISVITPSLDIELVSLTIVPSASGESKLLITLRNKSNSPVSNIKAIIDVAGNTIISEDINAVIEAGAIHSQLLTTGIIDSRGGTNFICVSLEMDGDIDQLNNKKCSNTGEEIVVFDPYPNPGSDQLNLDWVAKAPGQSELYIFDRTGKKVFDSTIPNYDEGYNHLTISLEPFNAGLYYVLFVAEGTRKSFPFVLRR